MMKRFCFDTETVIPPEDAEQKTEVWCWSFCGIDDKKLDLFEEGFGYRTQTVDGIECVYSNDLDDFFELIRYYPEDMTIYVHNLKFDASFLLIWLFEHGYKWRKKASLKYMTDNQFTTLISAQGQFYSLTMRFGQKFVTFRDSYKLIPMSLKKIGDPVKGFGTTHHKLEMDYKKHSKKGEEIDPITEIPYILNDVLVLREALIKMFEAGMTKMTIGGCALSFLRKSRGKAFKDEVPVLKKIPLTDCTGKETDFDEYCRRYYRGGFCYLNPRYAGVMIDSPIYVLDVNSLYPSMMLSESGNGYPIGQPTYFTGKHPDEYSTPEFYYMQHIKARFRLKKGCIPNIRSLWNNANFDHRDYIDSSLSGKTGVEEDIELYLTQTDLRLFEDTYNITHIEYIDGVYFKACYDFFDGMLLPFVKMKEEAPDGSADRQIAKLIMNNSYGKLSTSPNGACKKPIYDHGVLKYEVYENEKPSLNVALGAAICSYARNFTIRTAMTFGSGYVYSDTDSIHFIPAACDWEKLQKDLPIDDKLLNHWALEKKCDGGKYVRCKTYANRTGNKWEVTACGISENGKKYIAEHIDDFNVGMIVPKGCKMLKNVKGGVILVDIDKEIRDH